MCSKYVLLLAILVVCLVDANAQTGKPAGTIALMTDYGDRDFYVGAIKGAILSVCPQANIIDLTHNVSAYDIREGAFTLQMSSREFPPGTIFVAVVDPGVGTNRKPILLETKDGKFFVGPDNGLFTLVMREFGVKRVRDITNPEWMRKGKQSTSFHGRDIFAPAAAMLALGKPAEEAGPELVHHVALPIRQPSVEDKQVTGEVIFVDRYGNVQVNFGVEMLEKINVSSGDYVTVRIGDRKKVCKFVAAYGDVEIGEFLVLSASTGYMEIAVNQESAKEYFNAKIGLQIFVEKSNRK
jgi:S-adenosylmethionine hydrolase